MDNYLGQGRINAYQALTVPLPEPPIVHATIEYKYDNNGNQIEMKVTRGKGKGDVEITTYEYDFENRLTKIIHPEKSKITPITEYRYDGVGKRTQAIYTVDKPWHHHKDYSRVVNYLYDGLDVIIERDEKDKTLAFYHRGLGYGGGIGSIISATRESQTGHHGKHFSATTYYHYNGIGGVTELTDPKGKTVQSYTYDAYGNILRSKGKIENLYRFSTKEFVPQAGLIYFGARY